MMSAKWSFGLLLLTACGGTDIGDFEYGGGQPGSKLAEGGEIRHENVRILGMPEQTWVMVYQYTGPSAATRAPFAAPADEGKGQWGNCVDERNGAPTWPFTPITGATYLDLPKVALSGPGITGSLNITKTDPVNTAGNSTFRKYGFTYGGGAPGDIKGFNAGQTTAAMSTPGADYTIDIGKGAPMTYHMPERYTAPLGIGGAATVMIPAGRDLEYTWTSPANDKGPSGNEHNRKTYFNFTLFADPTSTNPPQFICFPDVDGHQLVPKAVIDALPPSGLIVNANLGHYMETREAASGEQRRFDLVSIFCNISQYSKQ
ncbi:MAG: hypothetical protein H7138_25905 [Myxococcales bacterium]|nr:hypothetical protein [Myxococcales bacterium]